MRDYPAHSQSSKAAEQEKLNQAGSTTCQRMKFNYFKFPRSAKTEYDARALASSGCLSGIRSVQFLLVVKLFRFEFPRLHSLSLGIFWA